MTAIRDDLRDKKVIDALALDLVNRRGWPEAIDQMKSALEQRATVALRLIHKYLEGGTNASVLKNLTTLRNEHLAHRDLAPTTAEEANATDKEIEEFYQDTSKLINILLGLVNATAYDPEDAAKVYRHYASQFWASARGEKTDGHPNYRQPPAG